MESYAMSVQVPSNVEGQKFHVIHVMLNATDRMEAIARVTNEIHQQAVVIRVDGPYPLRKESLTSS